MKRILMLASTLALSFNITAFAKDHTVKLLTSNSNGQTMVMEPAFIAVDVGDTITFVPSDASHNVQSIVVPEGAKTFNTQMGATVTLSFDQEGAYFYKCTPHFMLGMLGMVQVGNAVNKAAIESNWSSIKNQVVMNQQQIGRAHV